MQQKEIFLNSEGDKWFQRNKAAIATRSLENTFMVRQLVDIYSQKGGLAGVRVLEIGCGEGQLLAYLKNTLKADVHGIEPSNEAVAAACAKGINVQQGTADVLPYEDLSFDVVIFGHCLYLCDREDLFRIAFEADRVLRSPGWLAIVDFFSHMPTARAYHHREGIQSYKMDYRTLFNWHPSYECMQHELRHHWGGYTDDDDEWVAHSILRKHQKELKA